MNFLQHLNSRVFDFASSLQSRKPRNWVPIKYVTDVNLKPPFLPALTRLSDGLKLLFLRNDKLPETRALFLNSCSQNSDTLTIFLILTVEPHWKRGDDANNRNHLKLLRPGPNQSVFILRFQKLLIQTMHSLFLSVHTYLIMFLVEDGCFFKIRVGLESNSPQFLCVSGQWFPPPSFFTSCPRTAEQGWEGKERGGRAGLVLPRNGEKCIRNKTKLLDFNNSNALIYYVADKAWEISRKLSLRSLTLER